MGLLLIGAGSFFAWRMWLSYEKAQATRGWTPVACHIVSSKVVSEKPTPHSEPAHRVEVCYEYEIKGVRHRSTRIRQVEAAPTSQLADAREKQMNYPPGALRTCFVNPANVEEAILEHATRAALYSIWFPLLFVVGGLGMLRGAMKCRKMA